MASTIRPTQIRRLCPDRTTALGVALLVGFEVVLVATYVTIRAVRVTNPLVLVYPFVWIDASLVAILTAAPTPENTRQRGLGIAVAAGYVLVLGYFGGLYGIGHGTVPAQIDWALPPGYGPALLYDGSLLRIVLQPYKVIGYLTLGYLVYTAILDAARAAISGVVGLFSCLSCTWPIVGTIATSLFGSSSTIAVFALSQSYGLSTVVFLSAVGLLSYRPRS